MNVADGDPETGENKMKIRTLLTLLCLAGLLLAGLLSLPHEPYEAAAMDGANRFQIFWHLTFPMMAPISIGILIIRIIEASKIMETVYVLTSGGPGTSTETAAYYIFIRSLREFQIGYSAAM